jgi:type I restriction enzyme, S subunit
MQTLKLTKKYETYPEYKDSGVEWLGKIPKNWDVVSSRQLFITAKERVGSSFADYKILSLSLRGVIPRVLDGSGKNPAEYDTYQTFKKDDLVFCLFDYDVTPRTIGYVEEDGMMTGAYTRLIPQQGVCSKYFYYYFLVLDFNKELLHLCTGLRNSLSKPIFWSMKSSLPNFEEQEKIATYLDHKLKLIDTIIEKKEMLLKLLNEKKIAAISHTVTRGLNKNIEMIESEIPWLKQIPKNWTLSPNKGFLRKTKELVSENASNFELLSLTKGGVIVRDTEGSKGKFSTDAGTYQIVKKGDIIFCLFDIEETPRTVGLSSFDGMISGAYSVFHSNNITLLRYIEYYYIAMDDYKRLSYLYSGLRNTITPPKFLTIKSPIPPKNEQEDIVNFLDKYLDSSNLAVKQVERSIEKLKEIKTSLISNVVTGKIKV